jgi:RNA polymerase sigma-70 factor (ECF subfamily)
LTTEELFRRFAPFVARFLYRLGVDSDGLDDLVQEVFLVVHRRGGYKAGPAKPTSYLATIATNAASAYRRRRRIEQARSSDAEVEGLVSTNKGPVQVLEVGERLRLLQAALDRLEPEFRSTLILADIEGESCASIAASSGVATGTVYWRLHEARKRFQRALRAQAAGIPARSVHPDSEPMAAEHERRSVLALALNALWFLSDARRLLRAGAAQPPVDYDVGLGLDKHRELASHTGLPSHPPVIAPASVAVHTATGLGIAGASAASVAVVAVIAARLLLDPATRSNAAPAAAPHGAPATAGAEAAQTSRAEPARTSGPAPVTDSVRPDVPQSAPSLEATTDHLTGRNVITMPARRTASATGKAREPSSTTTSSSTVVESPKPVTPDVSSDTSTAQTNTQAEAREIARAERMLSSNPAGALAVVRDARSRFTRSFLAEERDYVEVMALNALGRSAEAQSAATRFLSAYPGGAFTNRVRKVLAK